MQMDRPAYGGPADRPTRPPTHPPMHPPRRTAHFLRRLTVVAYVLVGALIGGLFAVAARTTSQSTDPAPPTSGAPAPAPIALAAPTSTSSVVEATTTSTVAPSPTTVPVTTAVPAPAAPTTTVAAPTQPFVGITLKDFAVLTGARAATAGPLDFDVANVGPQPHELLIFASDLSAAQLPLGPDGRVDETGVGATKVFDSGDNVAVGTSTTFHTVLAPGHYVLICNLPGHYAAGMRASFTITT